MIKSIIQEGNMPILLKKFVTELLKRLGIENYQLLLIKK